MPTYTTLIIDDERPARLRLKRMLSQYSELIKILDEVDNGIEAL